MASRLTRLTRSWSSPTIQSGSPTRAGRHSRWLPRRRRRQSLVRLGHGHCAAGWGENLRSDRQADRLHRLALTLCKSLFWWLEAQSPVHGGKPLGLFALREHAGRTGWLTPAFPTAIGPISDIPASPCLFYPRKRTSDPCANSFVQ